MKRRRLREGGDSEEGSAELAISEEFPELNRFQFGQSECNTPTPTHLAALSQRLECPGASGSSIRAARGQA